MGGFTLAELLVVIGIIVLALAMAMPAFNYITGSRSNEAAINVISATLNAARTQALNDTTTDAVDYGVLFYRDPATERTMMALVKRADDSKFDPDPLDNYKGLDQPSGSPRCGSGLLAAGILSGHRPANAGQRASPAGTTSKPCHAGQP